MLAVAAGVRSSKLQALVALAVAALALITTIAEPQEQQTQVAVAEVGTSLVVQAALALSSSVIQIHLPQQHLRQAHPRLPYRVVIESTDGQALAPLRSKAIAWLTLHS